MTDRNLELYVASYPDTSSAKEDFEALKVARDAGDVKILASAIIDRDDEGKVDVKEHVAHSGLKASGGVRSAVCSSDCSPPRCSSPRLPERSSRRPPRARRWRPVSPAPVRGGILHEIKKHHDEKKMEKDVEEYLPNGSSAILVLIDDEVADRIDTILERADKRVTRAIDHDNYDKLVKALDEAGYQVEDELANA